MNTQRIGSRLQVALKQSTLALAVAAGLTVGSVQALTTTQTFNLGTSPAGTAFASGGASGLFVWIAKGDLPAGSILRSVTATNIKLEANPGDNYTGDIGVVVDPSPDTPGGADNLLTINDENGAGAFGGTVHTDWAGQGFTYAPFSATVSAPTHFPNNIDLHDGAVMFGSSYGAGTYSGTITIEYDAFVPAAILNFGPGATVGALVANAGDIAWTVPYGTNVTTLAPTFTLSSGSCDKVSGNPYDFTSPVTYTVTDGATVNTYTVTVTVTPASSAKDILTFGPHAIISGTDIAWTVPFGSDVTTLTPTYTVSTFASGSPVSGTTRNFTTPQMYTITAQDTTTQDYTVTVTVAPDESTVIWDIAGGGAWDLGTPNWEGQSSGLPTIFSNGDNVIFDKTDGGTITIAADMSPLTTTVSASSGTYTFSGGPIATGSLNKSGGGTLVLNSPNTYAGDTLIEGGRVRIENEVQDALGTGTVTLNGAILELSRQDIANPVIVGAGGGTISGGNSFPDTLVGAVTLNGLLTIDSGGTGSHRISGNITGAGGITKTGGPYGNGSGMVLSGTNTYSGATTIQSGVARITQPAALGGGDLVVETDGKLNLNYTGTKIVSSLTLGGVVQTAPGTYGSTASGSNFQNDTYFPPKGPFDSYDNFGTVTLVLSYADWATLYAGGPTAPADGDFNNDGVENGVAYFMGMNGVATNPGVVGNSVTWPYVNAVTSYKVQTSGNLSGWTDVLPGDPRLTDTGLGGTVSYNLLPNTPTSLFVRLLVTP